MRLNHSSFRLGRRSDRLVELVGRGAAEPTVAVTANAMDGARDPARRQQAVTAELTALRSLGLTAHELDLRDYRRGSDELAHDLGGYAALWVRGGNVFTLREAMHLSGADVVIPQLLAVDALAYAGYSAGGCVLAPDLRGLDGCDDPSEVRRLYGAEPRFDGLSVLDRAFIPHLDSPGHPETHLVGHIAERYRAAGVPFWPLSDGDVLIVDGPVDEATVC